MRSLIYVILLIYCMTVSGKRAIVTLLSGMPSNAERYTRLLHFFVYSLRNAGYDGEIAVMYVADFPVDVKKLAEKLNVKMKLVEKINVVDTTGRGNPHYASMLTKLHLWNLLEYEQVMYYDCDFVFQRNPASAFGECSWSNFCATADTGMHNYNRAIKPGTYFNGGFMVLKPNKSTFKYLLSNAHVANNKFFVEQDLLNIVYKDKWGKLNQKYNLMHCYQLGEISQDIVAIHEKMWILRQKFPQLKYLWNSSKMQIQYPISDLLTLPTKPGGAPPPPPLRSSAVVIEEEAVKELPQPYSVHNPFRMVGPDTTTAHNKPKSPKKTHHSHTESLNPQFFNNPTHYNNLDTSSTSSTLSTIPVPPSIAHNATAAAIYRDFVLEQIHRKSVTSLQGARTDQRKEGERDHTPLVAASINKAPKKIDKFARKPIPGPHKQPKRNKHKVGLYSPDTAV